MGKLLLLFILVPLVDAWLLLQIGGVIGFANTIILVLGTGLLGAWLFRLEGTRTWGQWQASLAEGKVPEEGVLGGVMLLLGGALLVTPGVITDAVGLLLLLPPTRKVIARVLSPRLHKLVKEKARSVVNSPNVRVVTYGFGSDPMGDPRGAREPEGTTEIVGRRVALKQRVDRAPEVIDADFEIKPE